MKVKSESEVAQSCPTLSDPMDCSLPGSSVHGIFQARVLEWGAIAFSEEAINPPKTFTSISSHGETPVIYGSGKSRTFKTEQKMTGNAYPKLILEGN